MRYQSTGKPEPRDNLDDGSDEADASELVDLGESPLPSRLDVPPASVRSLGRRLDPRLAPVFAIAIVVVALLGTGPLAPHPTPTTSASQPVGLASITPQPTDDSCPGGTAEPPTISLGSRTSPTVRASVTSLGATPAEPAVEVPVKRTVDVMPGATMKLDLYNSKCVELIGIDLIETGRPSGDSLMVRIPAPLEEGSRTVNWDAPPAGDWVVRVGLRLRAPLAEGAVGPWAVYFFRMNSGYVTWASPLPEGAQPQVPDGPLVTPGQPCGRPVGDLETPPGASLVIGDVALGGTHGGYQWRGERQADRLPDSLRSASPEEVGQPYRLVIGEAVCATNWLISVGPVPPANEPFSAALALDQSPDNPLHDPEIAAQNTFSPSQVAFGTYVIEAALEFQNGDRSTVYWLVHSSPPAFPDARIASEPSGDPVQLVIGCGASFDLDGGTGSEVCGPSWPALAEGPVLTVASGSQFRVDVGGDPITTWNAWYVLQQNVVISGGAPDYCGLLSTGNAGVGLPSIEIPAPPPGEWSVTIVLGYRHAGHWYSVPYYVRVDVPGEPGGCDGGFID